MFTKIKEKSKSLIEKLHQFVNDSNKVYSYLSEQFPLLMMEIDSNLKKIKEDLKKINEASNEGSKTSFMDETIFVIHEAESEIKKLQEKDRVIIEALENGINKLKDFEKNLGKIKTDSVEMELISLNAMTVALKAGLEGRAFSYITEELQRVSSKTIQVTDEITGRGKDVLNEFDSLQALLKDLKEIQNEAFSTFQEKLNQSFDGVTKGINNISSSIESISSKANEIKMPLFNIMQETQKQDIIKQSMDHVILSLSEFREVNFAENEDLLAEYLDELAFLKSLPALCTNILKDIESMILESSKIFKKEVRIVEDKIQNIENERKEFVDGVLAETQTDSINAIFKQSSDILRNIIRNLNSSVEKKKVTTTNSQILIKDMEHLDDYFKSFTRLITRFHSIDVASRIEVAKHVVLQKMSGTVEEMTRLTSRIEFDVNESINMIVEFIDYGHNVISDYRNLYEQEAVFVENFEKRIKEKYEALFEYKNSVIEKIGSFSIFTENFRNIFRQTQESLEYLNNVAFHIEEAIEGIEYIKSLADKEFIRVCKEYNIKDWKVKNSKLKSIISRFTIFKHKQFASNALDLKDNETKTDKGEMTFF